ncbi:ParB/Srx family N-terminal domain-containing protein [Spongiactinospora sp. TRM90649]|uniref:ParB/Srx family N-terminal domain-containing protein n=1 Tax=Spongiactinospora sp. TRM90649 TaxID=3031114 RepID=UPI0023F94BE4|nr:ParB/Srx family N-terminal domain-containing protein [Spongiactinospora sp. TRM90649]MDF5753058.1 ParB/Srx family N-terminal domain-containing protein [Spongiactinospora sp. TRM90649]
MRISSPYRLASTLGTAIAVILGTSAALAPTALAAAPGAPGTRPPFCQHDNRSTPFARYLCAKPGDLLDVRIGDVHPTQPSLGHDEVYYKLGRYTLGKDTINKKFDDWCETDGRGAAASVSPGARLDAPSSFTCELPVGAETPDSIAAMKAVVIGPGGEPFLTDGHHTLTSFFETPDGGARMHVRLRVQANLSTLTRKKFWNEMRANKWVWLRAPNGKPVTVNKLPTSVGLANFTDDKYRSLLYFSRDIGYAQNGLPFQEFYWGSWVRDAKPIDLTTWNQNDHANYLATVRALTEAMTALPKPTIIDNGFTAAQLGALNQWNDGKAPDKGEFDKLSKPYSDAKPGKLAYTLEYKRLHNLN